MKNRVRSHQLSRALEVLIVGSLAVSARGQDVMESWDRAGPDPGLVVGVSDWSRLHDVWAMIEAAGFEVVGGIPRLSCLRVVSRSADGAGLVAKLATMTGISYCEKNESCTLTGCEDVSDADFSQQWHLINTGQGGGTVGADMEMCSAWDLQTGDDQLRVAVLDIGFKLTHPEFEGRLLAGYDSYEEDRDPSVFHPHGTQVLGLLAANANELGVRGVDQHCRVLPVRVGLLGASAFDMAQGIDFAISGGARVMSASFGGAGLNKQVAKKAIQAAADADIVFVAACGNDGVSKPVYYPAKAHEVIAIGMTDRWDRWSGSTVGPEVDFVAPGFDVATVGIAGGATWSNFSGSSASTPLVAGLVSLIRADDPSLTRHEVYEVLRLGAEDQVGPPDEDLPGWDDHYGFGRVNAKRSLDVVVAGLPFRAHPEQIVAGDSQVLTLDAGPSFAGLPYLILGCLGSFKPGIMLDVGLLPLRADRYFESLLATSAGAGLAPLVDGFGYLDSDGKAAAAFAPDAAFTAWAGSTTVRHAFVVFDQGRVVLVSNSVAAELR